MSGNVIMGQALTGCRFDPLKPGSNKRNTGMYSKIPGRSAENIAGYR